jgi:AraC family transcriptional regulator, transcriptional activator FtrA
MSSVPRSVAVAATDGMLHFELALAYEVFGSAPADLPGPWYDVRVCGTHAVRVGRFLLEPDCGLDRLAHADTVIVPALADVDEDPPADLIGAVRAAHESGARVVSLCTGVFVLAAAGLLDRLRATTHWAHTDDLAARYPRVTVDPDVLYVDNGQFLTSAGAAAGLDLCLHLIRRDHGSAVAADAARLSVMPLEREGGQAQFIVHDQPPTPRGSILEPVLRWMQDNCGKDLTLDDIAAYAGMSTRTLNRRFREHTGTTPLQWLLRIRIRQAQYLLETTNHPLDRIATQVGFGSPTAFRDRFKRIVGTNPHAYRTAFHTPAAST